MGKHNKINIVNAEKENYKKIQESKPKRKHKPRYANIEELNLSRNTTRITKNFPGLQDRKGIRAMLKTILVYGSEYGKGDSYNNAANSAARSFTACGISLPD